MNSASVDYWGCLKRCDENETGIGKFFTIKLTKSKYSFGRGPGFFYLVFITYEEYSRDSEPIRFFGRTVPSPISIESF